MKNLFGLLFAGMFCFFISSCGNGDCVECTMGTETKDVCTGDFDTDAEFADAVLVEVAAGFECLEK